MTFSIIINIPVNSNGWSGSRLLPTIQINAPTERDASDRMDDVINNMPEGTTFHMEQI